MLCRLCVHIHQSKIHALVCVIVVKAEDEHTAPVKHGHVGAMSRVLLGLLGQLNSVALKEQRAFGIYGPYYLRLIVASSTATRLKSSLCITWVLLTSRIASLNSRLTLVSWRHTRDAAFNVAKPLLVILCYHVHIECYFAEPHQRTWASMTVLIWHRGNSMSHFKTPFLDSLLPLCLLTMFDHFSVPAQRSAWQAQTVHSADHTISTSKHQLYRHLCLISNRISVQPLVHRSGHGKVLGKRGLKLGMQTLALAGRRQEASPISK